MRQRVFGLVCAIIMLGSVWTASALFASTNWPNEPAGFTAITDWGFPTTEGNGWHITDNCSTDFISDATAPFSPPGVMRQNRPPNTCGGATYFNDWPVGYDEVYVGFRVKTSNPFTGYANNHNKLMYIYGSTRHSTWFYFEGPQNGPYHLIVYLPLGDDVCNSHLPGWGDPCGTWNLYANQGNPGYALGVWHFIELYIKRSTCTSCRNGTVRWWLDGVQQGFYTNVNFPDATFVNSTIGAAWDAPDTSWVLSWHEWDHIHISATGGRSSSDTTPPASPSTLTVR